jgi:HD-GYP domain-containing protein (c-di-GMP phosphodiesterase class II)
MKKHPSYGLHILTDNSLSENIKACCFEHHESFQGNGYPQELPATEIHPMARIVAICDTYDALTTKRSYSNPMHPREAMDLMTSKLAERFDPGLLKAMLEVMLKK